MIKQKPQSIVKIIEELRKEKEEKIRALYGLPKKKMNYFKQLQRNRIEQAKILILENFIFDGCIYETTKKYFDKAFEELQKQTCD